MKVKGLEHPFSVYPRRKLFREDLINVYKYRKGNWKEGRAPVPSNRARGSGHKPKHGRFPLNIRKHLHSEGDNHWHRLP